MGSVLFAATSDGSFSPAQVVLILLVCGLTLVGMWKTYAKAKWPGWAAIVPVYNIYAFVKIAGKPGWWTILFFIPFVNIIVSFMVHYAFVRTFGKGIGYMLLTMFLPFIGYPLLAWGDATYTKPKSPTSVTMQA